MESNDTGKLKNSLHVLSSSIRVSRRRHFSKYVRASNRGGGLLMASRLFLLQRFIETRTSAVLSVLPATLVKSANRHSLCKCKFHLRVSAH
jgi:hypothetical protein